MVFFRSPENVIYREPIDNTSKASLFSRTFRVRSYHFQVGGRFNRTNRHTHRRCLINRFYILAATNQPLRRRFTQGGERGSFGNVGHSFLAASRHYRHSVLDALVSSEG